MIHACKITWQWWDVLCIDAPMLKRVWQDLEYRIDVCRVIRGAPIEHL
jgi:hypothetical protein